MDKDLSNLFGALYVLRKTIIGSGNAQTEFATSVERNTLPMNVTGGMYVSGAARYILIK